MLRFVRFREVNEWEAETWNFWLQLDGNETELDKLTALLNSADEDHPYTLHSDDVEFEPVVDSLVFYSEGGYMNSHNKVTGTFVCPDSIGEDGDNLYKGGISDFFN